LQVDKWGMLYSLPKYLHLEVFDHDKLSSHDSMGKARIPMHGLSTLHPLRRWYKLTRHVKEGHKPLGWVMLELSITSNEYIAEPLGSPVDRRLALLGGEVKSYAGMQVRSMLKSNHRLTTSVCGWCIDCIH
jgi:hypothetical protein